MYELEGITTNIDNNVNVKPPFFAALVNPLFSFLVERRTGEFTIKSSLGSDLNPIQQQALARAYVQAFETWEDPAYEDPSQTMAIKMEYLQQQGTFSPKCRVTTSTDPNNGEVYAFTITSRKPITQEDMVEELIHSISYVYTPEEKEEEAIPRLTQYIRNALSNTRSEQTIPYNDLGILRSLKSRLNSELVYNTYRLTFLRSHLQALIEEDHNSPTTPLVFWTIPKSPMFHIARHRPNHFSHLGEFDWMNQEIHLYEASISNLSKIVYNPISYILSKY